MGLSRVLWDASIWAKGGDAGVVFTYSSHDGEEGYPGNVKLQAAYSLTAKNELVMEFSATTDKATPINMCNHAYWNLCGGLADKIYNHVLQLHAPFVLPADESSVRSFGYSLRLLLYYLLYPALPVVNGLVFSVMVIRYSRYSFILRDLLHSVAYFSLSLCANRSQREWWRPSWARTLIF